MEDVAEMRWVLLRGPEGPLVPYLDLFARELEKQGFKRKHLGPQIREAARFSQWLQSKQVAAEAITDEHAKHFLDETLRQPSVGTGERATLRRLLDFLKHLDITQSAPKPVELTAIQRVIATFAAYLRQEQALSDRTLIQYCPFAEQFLSECFGNRPVALATLRAADVIGFVKQQAAHLSPARAKAATTALRSFFRFLRCRGEIKIDLVAAVPTVPNWSMTGIPRAIGPEHLRAVFAHCPRDTPSGRRDYAILMLLARLGLRSSEIVSLTLDSIDWEAGSIEVVGKGAGKGKQTASLPLPGDVGEAIADYLQHGRPITNSRVLFLRVNAPIHGLGSQTSIATIVAAAIRRAGIETCHHGTHQFRHALASDMLRHGATLTEIGSVLRHRHTKTTSIYAKVDFTALRPISLPWPGGVK
jgi:integrase/recombinase XerD